MNTVTINKSEFKVKFGFRTFMLFEEVTDGKSINTIKTLKDMLMLYHCALVANNVEFNLTFDEFIDEVEKDENSLVVHTLTNIYNNYTGLKKNDTQPPRKSKRIAKH